MIVQIKLKLRLLSLVPEKRFNYKDNSVFVINGPAIATGRDAWVYGCNINYVKNNMEYMIHH